MKTTILKTISYLALIATIVPAVLVFSQKMDNDTNKTIMAVAMLAWFATAPFWINKKAADTD
ncbi:MAG: hypothetical protein U5K79_21085 [Cyclobacteriaceae bacterium]|nr:hypothetical protein [Cyclobacteriaceae bacterium]